MEQGKCVEESSPEAETMYDELTTTPISGPPVLLAGGGTDAKKVRMLGCLPGVQINSDEAQASLEVPLSNMNNEMHLCAPENPWLVVKKC